MSFRSDPERDAAFAELTQTYHSEQEIFEFWITHPELEVSNVGLRNAHKYAFSLRPENTPSVRPNPKTRGFMVTDFGGESRSITPMARLMELGFSKKEALDKLISWINGSEISTNQEHIQRSAPLVESAEKPAYTQRAIQGYLLNASNYKEAFNELLNGFLRASSDEEKITAQRLLMIGYCPQGQYDPVHRLILLEQDETGKAYGHYKYSRNATPKGILRKNARRVLLGSHLLARFGKDIIINEGHTDFAANISKELAAISSGSSTKRFTGDYLNLLAGKTLHDFPDLDVPGILGATHRAIDIAKWNAKNAGIKAPITHKVYLWSNWFKSSKLAEKIACNGFSASATDKLLKLAPVKNGEAFVGLDLLEKIQMQAINDERNYFQNNFPQLPQSAFIKNWQLLNKAVKGEVKQEGYDFVDFHLEYSTKEGFSEKYHNFLSKFKF